MKRWLSVYALSVTSIVIVAFLLPLAVLIRDLATDRALNAAEREAQTIARFAATVDDQPASLQVLESTLDAAPASSVQLSDGSVVGSPLPADIDLTAALELGQAYRQPLEGAQAVVVPVLRGGALPWVVVVEVSEADLTRGVTSAWVVLGGLGVALILLAYVIADRMGRAVVDPIHDLVEATQRLGKGELTVTVEPGGPSELAEVGQAFNTLTDRVSVLMDRERETAADLSHRLRTPMTALKLDVESMGSHVDVTRLEADIEEIERVVNHIIREARRSVREGTAVNTDLVAVVAERVEFWGTLGTDQGRVWSLDSLPKELLVRSSREDLEAMLDAALGNIFAHTDAGVAWRVTLRRVGGDGELVVEDDGPGISDPTLLERGESGAASTGLGVDIVQRTAVAAGGSAKWTAGSTGTRVSISLPGISESVN